MLRAKAEENVRQKNALQISGLDPLEEEEGRGLGSDALEGGKDPPPPLPGPPAYAQPLSP